MPVAVPPVASATPPGSDRARRVAPAALRRPLPAIALAACLGLAVLVAALLAAGGVSPSSHAGLGEVGWLVRWGLPVADLAATVAAVATVGLLLSGTVLLDSPDRMLAPEPLRSVRLAAPWAAGWAVAAAVEAALTMADLRGVGLRDSLAATPPAGYLDVPQTRALMETAALVAVVAAAARRVHAHAAGAVLLVGALLALLPSTLTGHAVHSERVLLAAGALTVHVGAAALWAGGLAVLVLHLARSGSVLRSAVPRYSRVALGCFVAVAVSGVANVLVVVDEPGVLLASAYGLLVLLKVLALGAAGAAGVLHRRRTLPRLLAGRPRAFLRLAGGELVVMSVAVALAVALSRAPSP